MADGRDNGERDMKHVYCPRKYLWLSLFIVALTVINESIAEGMDITQINFPTSPIATRDEFEKIKENAELGDPKSQLYLGIFYFNGDIVKQNFEKAAFWYSISSKNGNATAQRNLGTLYDHGIGVKRDSSKAFLLYKKASDQGEPAAHIGIAGLIYSNQISAIPSQFHWPTSGNMDEVLSQHYGGYKSWLYRSLACLEIQSSESINPLRFWREYIKGHAYFQNQNILEIEMRKRAEKGDGDAYLSLIKIYILPLNDQEKFESWMLQAALHGNPNAQYIVSQRNLSEASRNQSESDNYFSMFEKSAYSFSEPHITFHFLKEHKDIISHDEYFFIMLKLANAGYVDAQYVVANHYRKIFEKAKFKHWLLTAAKGGHPEAISMVFSQSISQNDLFHIKDIVFLIINSNDTRYFDLLYKILNIADDEFKLKITIMEIMEKIAIKFNLDNKLLEDEDSQSGEFIDFERYLEYAFTCSVLSKKPIEKIVIPEYIAEELNLSNSDILLLDALEKILEFKSHPLAEFIVAGTLLKHHKKTGWEKSMKTAEYVMSRCSRFLEIKDWQYLHLSKRGELTAGRLFIDIMRFHRNYLVSSLGLFE